MKTHAASLAALVVLAASFAIGGCAAPADGGEDPVATTPDEDALETRGFTYDVSPAPAQTGDACWRKTTARTTATPSKCASGTVLDANGLCYPACRAGFSGVGPVCWSNTGTATYTRGTGTSATCPAGMTEEAGLCYGACPRGYHGVGAVCWQNCPTSLPEECGAACTATGGCAKLVSSMASGPAGMVTSGIAKDPGGVATSALETLDAFAFGTCN